MHPPLGTPMVSKIFPDIEGKKKRLMRPRNHEIFFPDMFIEHVWEMTPTASDRRSALGAQNAKPIEKKKICLALSTQIEIENFSSAQVKVLRCT